MGDGYGSASVPTALMAGVPMLKISSKKIKQVIMRLENGDITWVGANTSRVPLAQIREIRLGEPPSDTYNASRWITVVYVRGSQWKVLHMIALTDDIYELWVAALPTLVSESSGRLIGEAKPCDPDLLWIRQLWPAGSKVIDMPTAVGLCRSIGLVVPEGHGDNFKGALDLSDFRQLIRDAQSRPEFETLFLKLSGGSEVMSRNDIDSFLSGVQKMNPDGIFDKYAVKEMWTSASFGDFLLSVDNVLSKKEDMTHSIVDYFISSSHNTYLVGDQLRGESTTEGYIRVLLGGCRCVEIDVHTGDFGPVVYHKKTLTTKIPFRDICRAINKYGFVSSEYPVIISAEIHCSVEQQTQAATIMREIFGDKLVTSPINDEVRLPSPEELRGRILFKAKLRADKSAPPSTPSTPRFQRSDTGFESTDSTTTESESGIGSIVRRLSIGSGAPDRPVFSAALADLLVYTAGVKYRGFSKLQKYEPHQQFSVSDRTAQRMLKESRLDWIKHNLSHLSRVYPHAIRLLSSNYDPIPFWSAGCQLVALNWQTIDEGLILNHGMFVDTPGYVLKPLALRQKMMEKPESYCVRVEIISAQRLPLNSDLYVEATLGNSEEKRTSVIKGTALNPVWDEAILWTFTTTPTAFDLTFLNLSIKNRNLLASWVRPLATVPRGYHHLPLYDPLCSKYVFATLFVRIDIDVVDDG